MSSPKTVEIADFNKQRKRSMGRDALEAAELPNILFIPFLMSQFLNPGIIYSNLLIQRIVESQVFLVSL